MKEMRHTRQRRSQQPRHVHKPVREREIIKAAASIPNLPGSSEREANAVATRSIYQDVFDVAPVSFYTLDRAGRICAVNEQGAKLLGFDVAWLLGKSFVVFIARQHVRVFLNFLLKATHADASRTIDVDLYVSGRTVPVHVSLTSVQDGNFVLHRLTVMDMTDFRKTETLLQESLSNWDSLIHNAPDTIMIVEPRGIIYFVNKPTWGYSVSALMGTNLLDHIPEAYHSKILRCLDQSFRFNRATSCEVAGGTGPRSRWFSFSFGSSHLEGVSYSNGLTTTTATTTTTVMIREISESKRIEETLRLSGQKLRDFATQLEAAREEERTRVAREIHDELGQSLTALKLDLSWLKSKTRGRAETRKRIKAMMAHIDQTIDCVRKIASELRPAILDDLGLIPAIEWQVSEFRKRTRVRTELVCEAEGLSLSMNDSVALFRVVQEALTNIMRHAKCTRVHIGVRLVGDALNISVEDNGRGITRTDDLKSLGIVGMRERISRLGGEFNIFSEPGKGTRLDIIIPTRND